MSNAVRKICVVVASRANYGRVKYLLKGIQDHPGLELQLIVGASALLERFGKAEKIIRADGFTPVHTIHYIVEGETLATQAKSTGMGIIELTTAFSHLEPDMVVTVADRFETMATAIAASYLNIPLVHLQGGEVSGNIDDRVRHAITKLADYHFVATEKSRERVIRMGEAPDTVFNYGCPAMDVLRHDDMSIDNARMARYGGVGDHIDWERPYLLMVQHPVTTSFGAGRAQIEATLGALKDIPGYQKVVLWPNPDAGSDDVSKGIRVFRESGKAQGFHFYRNFSPEDYARVLNNAACAIGNSSSFLREGGFLGVPVVLVGDRQQDREHADNVIFAGYEAHDILAKVHAQLAHGRYSNSEVFGSGDAGARIAAELTRLPLGAIKRITY